MGQAELAHALPSVMNFLTNFPSSQREAGTDLAELTHPWSPVPVSKGHLFLLKPP